MSHLILGQVSALSYVLDLQAEYLRQRGSISQLDVFFHRSTVWKMNCIMLYK